MAPVLPSGRGQFTSVKKGLGLRGLPFLWTFPALASNSIRDSGGFWEMRSRVPSPATLSRRAGRKCSSEALELSHPPNPMRPEDGSLVPALISKVLHFFFALKKKQSATQSRSQDQACTQQGSRIIRSLAPLTDTWKHSLILSGAHPLIPKPPGKASGICSGLCNQHFQNFPCQAPYLKDDSHVLFRNISMCQAQWTVATTLKGTFSGFL